MPEVNGSGWGGTAREMLFVSLHIPKTAGTSFATALREAYDPSEVLFDYRHDRDLAEIGREGCPPAELHQRWLNPGLWRCATRYRREVKATPASVKIVHGHFPACKYSPLLSGRKTRYITWLREPLERALSNYFFWRSIPVEKINDALARQVVEENWSVDDFCFHPAFQNYQTRWLGGMVARRFAFIGLVEHYEEGIRRLSRGILQRTLRVHRENRTVVRPVTGDFTGLSAAFREYRAADYALYESACRSYDQAC